MDDINSADDHLLENWHDPTTLGVDPSKQESHSFIDRDEYVLHGMEFDIGTSWGVPVAKAPAAVLGG